MNLGEWILKMRKLKFSYNSQLYWVHQKIYILKVLSVKEGHDCKVHKILGCILPQEQLVYENTFEKQK